MQACVSWPCPKPQTLIFPQACSQDAELRAQRTFEPGRYTALGRMSPAQTSPLPIGSSAGMDSPISVAQTFGLRYCSTVLLPRAAVYPRCVVVTPLARVGASLNEWGANNQLVTASVRGTATGLQPRWDSEGAVSIQTAPPRKWWRPERRRTLPCGQTPERRSQNTFT